MFAKRSRYRPQQKINVQAVMLPRDDGCPAPVFVCHLATGGLVAA
jgi:hypothetical protein